ncbi:DUF1905 domain-containing protein [Chryseotalea sanaruensis]|uniref:DUF1905 domain-containing protein n=1 Tax=Chryseotalea sanaruensis TaxID=2482724 RepID=A0A401U6Q6_9BACT|nr:YdeI/OmpD-associated family protein [Chryseotalea sanaruensis]GCC50644.1 DUF1905 domain-containing protein [Chryseotalea sanaruensis]
MVEYKTTILKYEKNGEKTGWTYIDVPADVAEQLVPNNKKSFRVKGKLDKHTIKQVALIPVGKGNFIIPINADIRKAIGKKEGAQLLVSLSVDKTDFKFDEDFMACLEDEPKAIQYFKSITASHQKYFSKWISSAKTEETKVKRITMAISALSRELGYSEMIRESMAKKG